ncbi:hypothetical protein SCP_1600330 [Sparassis crispa]|uniref:F-box domain-containing protein n=1 Tax=Sparassis crispa TaxID=139825 RepID=A0A401H4N2_9APHY|nr:hypothetical protein SCP_1600330 [Sparassis crispa]GBE89372.1 hypothetical protein SCP_1600330 [Sparassis crispa]
MLEKEQRTHLLSLNEDTLFAVISHLSTNDALLLSATTRVLHDLATRHALSSVKIRFRDAAHFKTFCRYLLADIPNRLYCVRRLEVNAEACDGPDMLDVTVPPLLADLLEKIRPGHLQALVLYQPEFIIGGESRIQAAISALPELVELRLEDFAGVKSVQSLVGFSPVLRKLALKLDFQVQIGDVLAGISHMQQLESLELSGGEPPFLEPIIDAGLRLPTVRYLHLSSICDSVFVHSFPNVRRFRLEDFYHWSAGSQSGVRGWQRLDYVCTAFMALQRWMLACPIHWLDLMAFEMYPETPEFDEMCAVLQKQIRPAVLSLRVVEEVSDSWTCLIDTLPDTRCLELVIYNAEEPHADQMKLGQIDFPALLARQNIMYIQIYLDSVATAKHPEVVLSGKTGSHTPLSLSTIAELDATMAAKAHRLACSIPSLKYIALGWRRPENDAELDFPPTVRASWWRVVGSGEGRAVEPMSMELGEWVSAQMRTPGCNFGAL